MITNSEHLSTNESKFRELWNQRLRHRLSESMIYGFPVDLGLSGLPNLQGEAVLVEIGLPRRFGKPDVTSIFDVQLKLTGVEG